MSVQSGIMRCIGDNTNALRMIQIIRPLGLRLRLRLRLEVKIYHGVKAYYT